MVSKAVIKHNLGNFGRIFDELHDALPKSLQVLLLQLRVSQGHAAKQYRCRMSEGVKSLFCQPAEPQTNSELGQGDGLWSQRWGADPFG